jgi:PKD repeat protein
MRRELKSQGAAVERNGVRPLRLTFALLATALLVAAPAQAHARHRVPHRHVQRAHRIRGVVPARRLARTLHLRARAASASSLIYNNGSVMHSSTTYAIYWLPSGYQYGSTSADSTSFESIVNGYLANVATDSGSRTNVYASDAQYTDGTGRAAYQSTFAASVVDTHAFPTTNTCSDPGYSPCLTDSQIQAEIKTVMTAQGWTGAATHLFILFTPKGVGSCILQSSPKTDCAYNGYCAYHSSTSSGILYANIAFGDDPSCASGEYPNGSAGADSSINLVSHEHNESITDPYGDGWWDSDPSSPTFQYENGDLCAWMFPGVLGGSAGAQYNQAIGGGHYYLQPEWSNLDDGCVTDETAWSPPTAGFTVNPAGDQLTLTPLHFSAAAQAAGVSPVTYTWAFGDGTKASGSAPTHSYATPGSRSAQLTVTDGFGSTAIASQLLVALDRPPVADIALPSSAQAGTAASFGPGSSSDPDGTIASYAWDFGDGSTGSGSSPQHTYAAAGTYSVMLTVTDDSGATASATRSLVVGEAQAGGGGPTPTPTPTPTPAPTTSTSPPPAGTTTTGTGTPATSTAVAAPRLTLARIAVVHLRRGRGTLVLRLRSSAAGRVVVTFRGVRRTFRIAAGTTVLRIALRGARPARSRVTLRPVGLTGASGAPVVASATLR